MKVFERVEESSVYRELPTLADLISRALSRLGEATGLRGTARYLQGSGWEISIPGLEPMEGTVDALVFIDGIIAGYVLARTQNPKIHAQG